MKRLIYILLFIPILGFSQTWVQVGQDIDGEAENDQSGHSVSLSSDGSIVAIGAAHNSYSAYIVNFNYTSTGINSLADEPFVSGGKWTAKLVRPIRSF